MKTHARKTKTFTEVRTRQFDPQKGAWGNWSLQGEEIDNQVNSWSEQTGSIILSIHAAVTYVNEQGENGAKHRYQITRHTAVWLTSEEYVEEEIGSPGDGQVLVENRYLAFEPAMRGWLNDVKSYIPPVGIGEVMRASTVGEVVESRHPGFSVGDTVSGMLGWQQYAIADGEPGPMGRLTKVPEGVPPPTSC